MQEEYLGCEYIVIKALENGVTIIGLTRGAETKFHHTEKLDKGEIMVVQFTEHTSAMKIRGNAEITHRYGTTLSESSRR
ncbi:MAG: trp RNA-binding attenuation protein MtrB [Syntrophomonadaceae bacterium]